MQRLQHVHPLTEPLSHRARVLREDDAFTLFGSSGFDPFNGALGLPEGSVGLETSNEGVLISAEVHVNVKPSQRTLQRVNRLIEGSGLKLKAYHRFNGDVALHDMNAGKYLPMPVVIVLRGNQWSYSGKTRGALSATKPAPNPMAVPAPVAPTAPAAAPEPASAPDPAPEPIVAPEPVSVAPARSYVNNAGLLSAPGWEDLMHIPVITPQTEIKVKREVAEDLDGLWNLHRAGKRQVICLIGPTGTGKTSLVENLAARQKVQMFNFDVVGARDFSDFVGVTHLRGDETVFIPSALLKVIAKDGPYAGQYRIVNLDEITRAESAQALNALIALLHRQSRLHVPEAGRTFEVDQTVMFTMTANRGAAYTGTVGLDLALANRVTAWVKMTYTEDPKVERTILTDATGIDPDAADRLIAAAKRIRDMDDRGELPEGGGISTRLLIEAAHKVVGGFTQHRAATLTWTGNYSDEGGTQSEAYAVQTAIDLTLR